MIEIPTYKFCLMVNDKKFLPTRTTDKASGWDVKANLLSKGSENRDNTLYLGERKYAKIPLGIKAFCPEGWWLELRPRSSTFGKKHIKSLYGVIDEDFHGELIFACQYDPDPNEESMVAIKHGESIGQLIPVKRQEMNVEEVSEEEYNKLCENKKCIRGSKGFGELGG